MFGSVRAQWWNPQPINFESITNTLIKIDTSQNDNIWQIGAPHKIIFDSAFSRPNAIVTDTVNYYPINNISSFQFTIYDSSLITHNSLPWQALALSIDFLQKYNTDSLKDGGYIEISADSGSTWISLTTLLSSNFYNNDTLYDGTPGFTGKSNGWGNGWGYVSFSFPWCFGYNVISPPPSMIVRFTFKSDSINTNKEGWMIDNLEWRLGGCEGVTEFQNKTTLELSPNPATTSITITSSTNIKEIKLINLLGESVINDNWLTVNGNSAVVDVSSLSKGIYFVQITTSSGSVNDKNVVNRKIIVN